MANRVQCTNDNSSISKASMISQGYFDDKFASIFVDKITRRSSLINRGYFIRTHAINNVLTTFLGFYNERNINTQILSLGSGYDSAYFRLRFSNIFKEGSKYFEIDFLDLQKRKLEIINKSHDLLNLINNKDILNSHQDIVLNSLDYKLIGCDLRKLGDLTNLLLACGLDVNQPTLLLSEVVLTYLTPTSSNKVIDWANKTFNNSFFLSYEQIFPNDGFGEFMCSHFSVLGSPLLSIHKYPTADSQIDRFYKLGWLDVNCCNMNDYYSSSVLDKARVDDLELFDEWEEWTLMCSHYIVLLATNHDAGKQIVAQRLNNMFKRSSHKRKQAEGRNITLHFSRDISTAGCITYIDDDPERSSAGYASSQEVIESCATLTPFDGANEYMLQRFGHTSTLFDVADIIGVPTRPVGRNNINNKGVLTVGGFGMDKDGRHERLSFYNVLVDGRLYSTSSRCMHDAHQVVTQDVMHDLTHSTHDTHDATHDKRDVTHATRDITDGVTHVVHDVVLHGGQAATTMGDCFKLDGDLYMNVVRHISQRMMHHTSSYIDEGRFLLFGGRESPMKALGAHILEFLGNSTKISKVDKIEIKPRWRHAASLVNFQGSERVLIFGGCNMKCQYLDDFWLFTHSGRGCQKIEFFKVVGRHSHSMTRWGESKIVICGGLGKGAAPLADIYILDFESTYASKVELASGSFVPRFSHSAEIVGDKLIVFGGVGKYADLPVLTIINLEKQTAVDLNIIMSPKLVKPFHFIMHTMVALEVTSRPVHSRTDETISCALRIDSDNENTSYRNFVIIGGGGNFFSFGTLFNKSPFLLKIPVPLLNS